MSSLLNGDENVFRVPVLVAIMVPVAIIPVLASIFVGSLQSPSLGFHE